MTSNGSSPTFPNPTGSTTVLTLTNMLSLSNRLAPTAKAPSSGPPNFVILSSTCTPTQNAPQNTLYALPISSAELAHSALANSNNRPPLIGLRTAPTEIRIYPRTPRDHVVPSPQNGPQLNDLYGAQNSGDRRSHHSRRGASSDRAGKGLRHFSMKVCEKVHRKGVTTYNEVADELVSEYALQFPSPPGSTSYEYLHHHHHGHLDGGFGGNPGAYDHKNIRRRVYDALNVLMAMNIISKEKKEIRWIGLPTNSHQEFHNLEKEKQKRVERIKEKQIELNNLLLKQIALKNLIEKNRREKADGLSINGFKAEFKTLTPAGASPPQRADQNQSGLYLPFILINTEKSTEIDCSISNDKCEYYFNFNNHFEVDDDFQVLKKLGLTMGLDRGRPVDASVLNKALNMVPPVMHPYVKALANGNASPDLQTPEEVSRALDKPMNDRNLITVGETHGASMVPSTTGSTLVSPSCFMTSGPTKTISTNLMSNTNLVRTNPGINNSFTNGSLATLQFKNFITAKNLIASLGNAAPTPLPFNNGGHHSNLNSLLTTQNAPLTSIRVGGHLVNGPRGNEDKGGSSTSTSDIYSSEDSNGSQSNSSSLNSLRA